MTRLMIYYDIHWISSDSCHVAENMFAWSCRRQKNSWRPIRPGKMDYAMWYIVIRSKMRELLTLQAHQVIHKAIVWRLPVSPSTHDTSCIPKNACTFVSHQLQLPSSWIPQGSPQEAHFHVAKIWQGLKGRQTRTWPARMVARHSSWPSRWLQNLPMVINCPCKGPIYDSHFELCWRMSSWKSDSFETFEDVSMKCRTISVSTTGVSVSCRQVITILWSGSCKLGPLTTLSFQKRAVVNSSLPYLLCSLCSHLWHEILIHKGLAHTSLMKNQCNEKPAYFFKNVFSASRVL